MANPEPTEQVAIYHYTVILKDGDKRECNAAGYGHEGGWLQFDDTLGMVLKLREELVAEFTRGEKIGEQTVDLIA